jgi:hypothetical protein
MVQLSSEEAIGFSKKKSISLNFNFCAAAVSLGSFFSNPSTHIEVECSMGDGWTEKHVSRS